MIPWLSFDGGRGSFCESCSFDTARRAVLPLSASGSTARLPSCSRRPRRRTRRTRRTRRVGVISVQSLFHSRRLAQGDAPLRPSFDRPSFSVEPATSTRSSRHRSVHPLVCLWVLISAGKRCCLSRSRCAGHGHAARIVLSFSRRSVASHTVSFAWRLGMPHQGSWSSHQTDARRPASLRQQTNCPPPMRNG
jgi:hypothetical protein